MFRINLIFFAIISLIGCTKDDTVGAEDSTWFLREEQKQFRGVLDSNVFKWTYGANFQETTGFAMPDTTYDSTSTKKLAVFGLMSNGNTSSTTGINSVYLYSPIFDKSDKNNFYNLFTLGKKKVGKINSDFYLEVKIGNTIYKSNNIDNSNSLEILKTEEFTDFLGKQLRVWLKINSSLSSCNCPTNSSRLKNCHMLAEFFNNIKPKLQPNRRPYL